MLPPKLLLLHLLKLNRQLSLLFLLTTEPLFFLSLFLGILSLQPIFLFFELPLTSLLPLFLLEVANEALSGDLLALVALPDALGHALKIRAEQMVRFFARAAVNEVTGVLALEAVVWVLNATQIDYKVKYK